MEITDSPFLSKADLSKHFDVRDGSIRGEDLFSRGIQFFAAMPERVGLEPVWMASFSSQFLKETGVEFDRKEFVSNPNFIEEQSTPIIEKYDKVKFSFDDEWDNYSGTHFGY